jgi:hypothetical protein
LSDLDLDLVIVIQSPTRRACLTGAYRNSTLIDCHTHWPVPVRACPHTPGVYRDEFL